MRRMNAQGLEKNASVTLERGQQPTEAQVVRRGGLAAFVVDNVGETRSGITDNENDGYSCSEENGFSGNKDWRVERAERREHG